MTTEIHTGHDAKSDDGAAAAKEAAQLAASQAKDTATEAFAAIKTFDRYGRVFLGALAVVMLCSVLFDIVSFDVHTDRPVTPTMANEMRDWENLLNASAYSAFTANLWGKVLFVSALAGTCLLLWGTMSKQRAAWIPLATVGCAAMSALMLLLLAFTGTPAGNLLGYTPYLQPDVDLTILGYWVPLLAAATAVWAGAKRIMNA